MLTSATPMLTNYPSSFHSCLLSFFLSFFLASSSLRVACIRRHDRGLGPTLSRWAPERGYGSTQPRVPHVRMPHDWNGWLGVEIRCGNDYFPVYLISRRRCHWRVPKLNGGAVVHPRGRNEIRPDGARQSWHEPNEIGRQSWHEPNEVGRLSSSSGLMSGGEALPCKCSGSPPLTGLCRWESNTGASVVTHKSRWCVCSGNNERGDKTRTN
jgi:hypothetical protein